MPVSDTYAKAHDQMLASDWRYSSVRRQMRPPVKGAETGGQRLQRVLREKNSAELSRIYREVTGSSATPDGSATTMLLLEVLRELRSLAGRR